MTTRMKDSALHTCMPGKRSRRQEMDHQISRRRLKETKLDGVRIYQKYKFVILKDHIFSTKSPSHSGPPTVTWCLKMQTTTKHMTGFSTPSWASDLREKPNDKALGTYRLPPNDSYSKGSVK